jgi:hypothetical protein
MEMFALSLLALGVLWVVTLIGILGLAGNGRFSFPGGGYALPVLAHVVWGFAALAVATELATVPAILRLVMALIPAGIHLAWLLSPASGQPILLVALGAQFLVPMGLAMVHSTTQMARHNEKVAELQTTREKENEVYDQQLKELLGTFNAGTEMNAYFNFTRDGRESDQAKDLVVARAVANHPDLEARLIEALHGDDRSRYGATSFLCRPAAPQSEALAVAVRDSILLEAGELAAMLPNDRYTEDMRDSKANGAVAIATRFQAYDATVRPAMRRLREVTGPPAKRSGVVTGRQELDRWLR